ncbi:hypothetical protein C8039_02160 [Halogeometricum sp. wsp3]|nr:hypothetical protein C8039_02160 [Halogeometricum sp. wsp3]
MSSRQASRMIKMSESSQRSAGLISADRRGRKRRAPSLKQVESCSLALSTASSYRHIFGS